MRFEAPANLVLARLDCILNGCLYIEAIEDVYGEASKVLMDASGSGNLLYLPVDKIMEQQQRRSSDSASGNRAGGSSNAGGTDANRMTLEDQRRRGTR